MSPLVGLPGGDLRDEIRQPVYDGIFQQAGEAAPGIRRFFSNVQGKSKALTNLRQNNLLETAVSYLIQGFAIDVQNFRPENRNIVPLVMERSSIQVRIGEKIYFESPWTYIGGRLEADMAVSRSSGTGEAAGTVVDRVYQKLGQAAVAPVVLTGKHTIPILPLQSFEAIWTCGDMTAAESTESQPAAGTVLLYLMSFKGLQRRPVQ